MRVLAVLVLLLGSIVAFATPVGATTPTFVQGAVAENSGYTITVSYAQPVASGDLLVAWERNYDDHGGTLTDTLGGTWKRAIVDCTSWDIIWYRTVTTGGNDSATLTSAQHGLNRLALMEYSGVAGTLVGATFAQGPVHCGTVGKVASTGASLTAPAGDLIVGGFTTTSNATASAARVSANGVDGSIDVTDAISGGGTASQTLTWSKSVKWWAAVAVFS